MCPCQPCRITASVVDTQRRRLRADVPTVKHRGIFVQRHLHSVPPEHQQTHLPRTIRVPEQRGAPRTHGERPPPGSAASGRPVNAHRRIISSATGHWRGRVDWRQPWTKRRRADETGPGPPQRLAGSESHTARAWRPVVRRAPPSLDMYIYNVIKLSIFMYIYYIDVLNL